MCGCPAVAWALKPGTIGKRAIGLYRRGQPGAGCGVPASLEGGVMATRLWCPVAVTAAIGLCPLSPPLGKNFPLPDGPEKEIVAGMCGGCHALNRLGAGYTAEGWHTVMRMMLNFDAPIPKDQVEAITAYLSKAFPERPRPAAAVIAGPAEVAIKEWPVATPGSRPHDPLAAKDGAIWYTGQLSNKLGRLDPKTGQIKEYPLKTPQTAPHGLVEDRDGNIWFTGNFLGLIGKLDPGTGAVTEYKLPDPNAKDPHSLTFDQSGTLWFTVQQSNMVGRLDPKTGDIRILTSPTPASRPYGIQVNSQGIPFFVEFGTNKVDRIDPQTLAITEYKLPDPAARPRRLSIGEDDRGWNRSH